MKEILLSNPEGGLTFSSERIREKKNNKLTLLNDDIIKILKLPIIIGRHQKADIIIMDAHYRVSRAHAQIFEEKGAIKIIDLSRFGTWIVRNKKEKTVPKKEGIELQNKDIIRLSIYAEAGIPDIIFGMTQGWLDRIKSFISLNK